MLERLTIHNFALIDRMDISFGNGTTIFTGETGAGKSILMDAFSVLLGARADREYVRQGSDGFTVQGIFFTGENEALDRFLVENNIVRDEGCTLLISRSFSVQGRGQILVDGQPIPLKVLKELGNRLADIHGQYDNQILLDEAMHHRYVDEYDTDVAEAFAAYTDAFTSYESNRRLLKELTEKSEERARELELLRFQIDEIEDAELRAGEDEALERDIQRFDNFERLHSVLGAAYDALYEGRHPIMDALAAIRSDVSRLTEYDEALETAVDLFSSGYFQLEEAAAELDRYRDSISFDEERYAYCQQRDTLIYGLKKKYGKTIADILAFEENAQLRLEELERLGDSHTDVEARLASDEARARKYLAILQTRREETAEALSGRLTSVLHSLGMEQAKIEFRIEPSERLTKLGANEMVILFSANAGEEPVELHKVASGGELSRIALAFKSVFNRDTTKTLVFDEIDVGISGDVALKVAKQLQTLGRTNQVFCITHLPQTAAIGDAHCHLEKKEIEGRTVTTISVLTEEEHVRRMARMMSGEAFEASALQTARELTERMRR